MTIKYNVDLIQQINLFEKIAQADVKECFNFKEKLTFMVEAGQLGRALGKNKSKLIKLEATFKKPLRIIEYSDDLKQFITNLIAPLKILNMDVEDGVVIITGPDTKTKGLMIGSKAKNLRETEEVVKKYFPDLKEIKVI